MSRALARSAACAAARPLLAAALVLMSLAGGCAPKTAPPPAAPGAPKFPEFIFPAPPSSLAPPVVAANHTVAWQSLQAGDLRAAERNFTAVLKQAPGFYPSEAGLGYVALARKDNKE